MYAVAAGIQDARTVMVPLVRERNFALDVDAVLQAMTPEVKLVFLCSPNNPTGSLLDRAAVLSLVRSLAGHAVVAALEAALAFFSPPRPPGPGFGTPHPIILRTHPTDPRPPRVRVGAPLPAPRV